MKGKVSRKELEELFSEGARFRDTSQQIHKQWQADPARAFPTVGSVGTGGGGGGGSPSPASGDISTPNSTPSPSPSPTNGQLVMGGNHLVIDDENNDDYNDETRTEQNRASRLQHEPDVVITPTVFSGILTSLGLPGHD
ncbi:hypothetical protein M0804_003548 [Polistes exclamans]|nr:hypothetical protein M0804_003548 [Polistes exclamans]